jgi:hypothetical protein
VIYFGVHSSLGNMFWAHLSTVVSFVIKGGRCVSSFVLETLVKRLWTLGLFYSWSRSYGDVRLLLNLVGTLFNELSIETNCNVSCATDRSESKKVKFTREEQKKGENGAAALGTQEDGSSRCLPCLLVCYV